MVIFHSYVNVYQRVSHMILYDPILSSWTDTHMLQDATTLPPWIFPARRSRRGRPMFSRRWFRQWWALCGCGHVVNDQCKSQGHITGWWFGTWLDYDFPIILGMSSSQLTLTPSFFRGVAKNQQPGLGSSIWNVPSYGIGKNPMSFLHSYE